MKRNFLSLLLTAALFTVSVFVPFKAEAYALNEENKPALCF